MINYEGRRFYNPEARDGVIARYHQRGDLVWAHFAGGAVRRGSVTGLVDENGALRLAYSMVLSDGEIVCGVNRITPERAADGTLRLREEWERLGPNGSQGVCYLEEIP
ncbi:hypothetical protein ACIRRA_35505 [Nocardia sp. NPDC101769]|uniref:hypothetical protein n=1 Tax=Nocardia sp. NPDC101769 TaxID=3364333 RepID=UPI00382E1018